MARRSTPAALAAVFVLEGALALTLAGHPLLQPVGELDAGEYWRLAQRVAAGDLLLAGTEFYVSPLYIYVLAGLQRLAGGSLPGVLLLQAALGTAAVWMVGRAAWLWSGSRVAAVVAAALTTFTGSVALQQATILQSAIDPVLTAGWLLAFTLAVQRGRTREWGACGVALALLALNRPNAWLLAAVCVAAAIARPPNHLRLRAAGAWTIGVLLVLAPFTMRTVAATGEWQVLPGHGGLNLYIGNHSGATGTYTVVDGIRPSIDGQRVDARRVAEAATGRTLTPADVSSFFVRRAVGWWVAEPVAALRLTVFKVWLAIHAWELPVNVSYAWFREQVLLVRLLPVGAWLLVPLGVAALVAGHRGVPAAHADGWRWFRWVPPVYVVSVVLGFVVDRYRAPLLVMAAVASAPLVGHVVGAVGTRRAGWWRPLVPAAACAALVMAVALVPLPFDLGRGEADARMALHAIEAGRDEEAQTWLARADTRHPTPGLAHFRAGLAWQARGRWQRAEAALRRAHQYDADVPGVGFELAETLLAQGKGADAVSLLHAARAAGVRPDRVTLDLALALWQAGDERAARAALDAGVPAEALPLLRARGLAAVDARQARVAAWLLEEYRQHVATDAEVAEKLGLMLATEGRLGEAATALEDACRLAPTRATARFNLALVRLRQGRRDEAVALLREALRLDPGYAQAAGALREIQ